jgi:hemerythrin
LAYIWSNELATGNTAIDTQHKQLVKALNDLLEACNSGKGRTQLNETMQFLINYTVQHFKDEEALQQKYNYPDYPNHKKLHETFKVTVTDMAKQFQTEGPTITMVSKLNAGMGGWLVNHIQREDKKIADHIRGQGK